MKCSARFLGRSSVCASLFPRPQKLHHLHVESELAVNTRISPKVRKRYTSTTAATGKVTKQSHKVIVLCKNTCTFETRKNWENSHVHLTWLVISVVKYLWNFLNLNWVMVIQTSTGRCSWGNEFNEIACCKFLSAVSIACIRKIFGENSISICKRLDGLCW